MTEHSGEPLQTLNPLMYFIITMRWLRLSIKIWYYPFPCCVSISPQGYLHSSLIAQCTCQCHRALLFLNAKWDDAIVQVLVCHGFIRHCCRISMLREQCYLTRSSLMQQKTSDACKKGCMPAHSYLSLSQSWIPCRFFDIWSFDKHNGMCCYRKMINYILYL